MNSLYDIETFVLKKKSKEQSDREWQYFAKEQEKAFAELLIEKGIKKQETIITDINTLALL